MSTSKQSTRSWWAVSSTRARLTVLGASVLVLALLATSVIVWLSPANPINRLAATEQVDPAHAALMDERNKLLSQIVDLRGDLESSDSELESTKAQLADIQQQLWSAEGKMEADAAADAARKPTTITKTRTVTNSTSRPVTGKPKPANAPIVAPTKAELVNPASPYFGMYTEQAPFNWATYDSTATKIGQSPNVVGFFSGWDENYRSSAVTRAWQRDTMPIMTWESRPISAANDQREEPEYSLPGIIGDPAAGVPGKFDDYLRQYARDIKTTGLPLGIRLNHEMNGDWYPWSETDKDGDAINGNRVGDYVKAWQHVHDIFEQEGANDLVVWIWAPNIINNLWPTMQTQEFLAHYYPGDEYADWVGLSGYLRPPYRTGNNFTFDYTFTRSLDQLRALTAKPIFLAEVGASEIQGHKTAWVKSLFEGLASPDNSDIVGIAWFSLVVTNRVEGQLATNDWRIDSSSATVQAFKTGFATPGSRFTLTPIP